MDVRDAAGRNGKETSDANSGRDPEAKKRVKESPKASKEICKTKIRKGKKKTDTALDRMVSPAPQKVTQLPGCRDPIFFFLS